ncbi:MAG: glycosyltransferase family 1 protein [Bacillota bacterium]
MEKPIRILQVFGRMDRGGAESMIMNIYRNIDRSKVQFDFVVHTDDKCHFDEEIYSLGGKIHHVPKYTIKNHFSYKKAWNDFFKRQYEYKIIHGHMYSIASIYLKIAKKHGLTTIAHSHNTSDGSGISAIIKAIYRLPIKRYADYKFACGTLAGQWLYKNNDFKVINNSIEINKYKYNSDIASQYRNELGLEHKFIIGHVGRFNHQKNHEFLIDIFYEIQKKRDDAVLLLVGDGELRSMIEEKTRSLGILEKVIFTGIRDDVPNLMQAMDVFLFPSHYEGLPVVLVEAQATGLQCVVSDVITDEIDILNLCRVSLNKNAEEWAECLLSIDSKKERELCNDKIAKAGYDIKISSAELEKFYLNSLVNL